MWIKICRIFRNYKNVWWHIWRILHSWRCILGKICLGSSPKRMPLTHWGRVTHICVSKFTIIGSDNGLAPGRRQAIIWTNDIILLIIPLGTNFNEILIGNQTFSLKKMHLKMSSAKWRPFCLGLNVLTHLPLVLHICVSELGQHWRRRDDKSLPETMLVYCQLDP